jgi:hypothetical protein
MKRKTKSRAVKAKITLGDLVHPDFVVAQQKLMSLPLPGAHAYALKKIFKSIREDVATYNEARQDMMKKFCKLTERGTVEIGKDGRSVSFKSNKDKEDFLAEEEELQKQEVKVSTFPIKVLLEGDYMIEPGVLLSLEAILDETGM